MTDSILPPENLFAALPAELSRGLFEKARIVTLAADQMLFLAGDAGDGCYRVEEGLLKASVFASGGGERILAIFGPCSLVGELSMIDGVARSASVAALRPSKLSLVSRASFDAFARSNPELNRHVMTLLARRLRETNRALAAASFLPQEGRIARVLLSLAEAFGNNVGGGANPGTAESHAKRPCGNGRPRPRKT
jgi:CRP/FNR family cyclic AMP-dependent transcriptional regulator